MSAFSALGSYVSDAQKKAYNDELASKKQHAMFQAELEKDNAIRAKREFDQNAFQAKLNRENNESAARVQASEGSRNTDSFGQQIDTDFAGKQLPYMSEADRISERMNKSAFGDDFGKEVANTGTGTQKITVEGVDTQGNKTTTVTEASKDAKNAFINNQGLGVTRRPDALDLTASQPTIVSEEQALANRKAPARNVSGDTVDAVDLVSGSNPLGGIQRLNGSLPFDQAMEQADAEWQAARMAGIPVDGLMTAADSAQPANTFGNIPLAQDLESANAFEDNLRRAEIESLPKEEREAAQIKEQERKVQVAKRDFENRVFEEQMDFTKKKQDAASSPEGVMAAAQAAGAVYSDGTIDQDWLDNYNRSTSPSDFDTSGIEEEREAVPFDRSILKSEKEKAKAAEEAKKLAETDPGTFSEIMGGITDWFKTEGNDEEGFWDSIGGWVEENPVWANTIASGVASYIETGNPYEAVGKGIKGAVSGMDSKKKAEAAARKEDIELNKLYTGDSIEKYRETNKITDLVGRLGAPEISGKANQYKAVNGKTYGVWNKDGVSYTRINGKFVPAPEAVLTGKDVSSATAENDTWNGIGKASVANVIDQIKSQPAEYRIPTPSLSMSNKIQKGVNALRKAFPGIDPNDPNIGSAVDDWFAANNARFEEDGKNFKWDTNVEKYMMNNIIMGKTTAENIDMANAFEIGGDGKNQHDVNVEETALAWNKINAFVSSNKEDEFVTPAQGMKYGYDLYIKDWKPGKDNESPEVKAARDKGIPPFIYFMNTVDFK